MLPVLGKHPEKAVGVPGGKQSLPRRRVFGDGLGPKPVGQRRVFGKLLAVWIKAAQALGCAKPGSARLITKYRQILGFLCFPWMGRIRIKPRPMALCRGKNL